jgi:hypothetical protein
VIIYQVTTDAVDIYRERTAVDLVRADSAAQDGTLSSLIKNNTVVFSKTVLTPVPVPKVIVGPADLHKGHKENTRLVSPRVDRDYQ